MNFLSKAFAKVNSAISNTASSAWNKITSKPPQPKSNQTANVSNSFLGTRVPVLNEGGLKVQGSTTAQSTPVSATPQGSYAFFNPGDVKTIDTPTGPVQYAKPGSTSYTPGTAPDPTLIPPQPRSVNPYGSTPAPYYDYGTGTSYPSQEASYGYGSGSGAGTSTPNTNYGSGGAYQVGYTPYGASGAKVAALRGGEGQEMQVLYEGDQSLMGYQPQSSTASMGGGSSGSYSSPVSRMGITQTISPSTAMGQAPLSMPPESEEERNRRKNQAIDAARSKLGQQGISPRFFGNNLENLAAFDDAGNVVVPAGKMAEFSGVQAPSATYGSVAGGSRNFRATTPTGALDIGGLSSRIGEISKAVSAGSTLSVADRGSFYNELETLRQNLTQQLMSEDPVRSQPFMQETQGQWQFINSQPKEQRGTIRAMLDAKAKELKIPELNADIEKTRKELLASEKIYEDIITEIEADPDLPKSLAKRRIEDFTKTNSRLIKNLQGKLSILEEQKKYANETLDREFDIAQFEEDQYKNDMQVYQVDGQLVRLNPQTGQHEVIYGISKTQQKKYEQFSTQLDNDGNITVIGIKPDGQVDVLEQIGGVGKSTDPTQGQFTAANYATRIQQANPILEQSTQAVLNMNPTWFEAQVRLPSYLQSTAIQNYMQASRNFINAVLRRESGAVISPTEFAEARKQYLPYPGDDPSTLEQKRQTRMLVQQNFSNEAGRALGGQQSTGNSYPIGTVAEINGRQYRKVNGGWQLAQ